MKTLPSALLPGLIGLAIADEAAAPSGAASGSLPATLARQGTTGTAST